MNQSTSHKSSQPISNGVKFAVIETGGKQYLVKPQDKIRLEKLPGESGANITFDKVLLVGEGDKVSLGTPYLSQNTIAGKILKQGRADKVLVMKYHNKTRYRRKRGHRQLFTEVEITAI